VTGHTADPRGSTEGDRYALSLARAQAVAAALTSAGLTHPITAVGGGTAPGPSATSTGGFDEDRATRCAALILLISHASPGPTQSGDRGNRMSTVQELIKPPTPTAPTPTRPTPFWLRIMFL
jgi:hypothetical protein